MAQDEGKTSRNLNVGRYQCVHLHKNKIPIVYIFIIQHSKKNITVDIDSRLSVYHKIEQYYNVCTYALKTSLSLL